MKIYGMPNCEIKNKDWEKELRAAKKRAMSTETELRRMCAKLACRLYRHVDMRCTCKDPDCLNDRQTLIDYTALKGELKG